MIQYCPHLIRNTVVVRSSPLPIAVTEGLYFLNQRKIYSDKSLIAL